MGEADWKNGVKAGFCMSALLSLAFTMGFLLRGCV